LKSHLHYSCTLLLCIESTVLLISTYFKCKTFNKWDNIADLWINLHQNSLQRYLKWISRLVDLLIIIFLSAINILKLSNNLVTVTVIHTFLWHQFRLDSWETLCYLYRVNKTLWERKSLVVYTTASRSRNNEIDTVLSSNESIASIQRVTLE